MRPRAWQVLLLAGILLALVLPQVLLVRFLVDAPTDSPSHAAGSSEVWSWGHNDLGELASGIGGGFAPDGKLDDLSGVVALAAGNEYGLAVRADGTLWSWGMNQHGRLGDGTLEQRWQPVQVRGLDRVAAVAAGEMFALALREDGSVWTWGEGLTGQLGDGTTPDHRPTPARVAALSDIVSIAAGRHHALAARADGTVWGWGQNEYGQLGSAASAACPSGRPCVPTPTQIVGPGDVVEVAAGRTHSLALAKDGAVWSWGGNAHGQLGDGSTSARTTPAPVPGLKAVRAIAAGQWHSLALRDDGALWAWGANNEGQLGDRSNDDRPLPVQVGGLSRVRLVASWGSHSLAVREDGTLWAWGRNYEDQLGIRVDIAACGQAGFAFSMAPVRVPGFDHVEAVASSDFHSLALSAVPLDQRSITADPRRVAALSALGMPCPDMEAL